MNEGGISKKEAGAGMAGRGLGSRGWVRKKKSRREERGGQRKAGAADRPIQTAQIGPGG